MELLAVLAVVYGLGSINAGTPETALEVGNGRWVGAPVSPDSRSSAVIGGGVDRGVTLDVKVERGAESSVVALGGALGSVVGGKSVNTEV